MDTEAFFRVAPNKSYYIEGFFQHGLLQGDAIYIEESKLLIQLDLEALQHDLKFVLKQIATKLKRQGNLKPLSKVQLHEFRMRIERHSKRMFEQLFCF